MKAHELSAALRPYKAVVNPRALSPAYRVIEIGAKLRASCGWAHIETDAALLDKPACVDGAAFIAVVESLSSEQEFAVSRGDGTLDWKCGSAKGRLALVPEIDLPTYSRRLNPFACKPSADMRKALDLGSLSSGTNALATVGLFGVRIEVGEKMRVLSSDNMTISLAEVTNAGDAPLKGPDVATFSPEGIELLVSVLGRENSTLELDDKAAHVVAGTTRVRVNQIDKLATDLHKIIANYDTADVTVKLPRERVAAFVKRAGALAEAKRHTAVWIGAEKGRLTLSFSEGTASSDEYYLVEGLDVPDLPAVQIDANKLARALSDSDDLVLDHIERSVLVLRGDKPAFQYLISGRKG